MKMSDKTPRPTLCIATLGCKVNKADSELMQRELLGEGYRLVPFDQGADVYIINTCTVTARSDYQSRQLIRRALRHNSRAQVVVTGCYAQTNPAALQKIPGISLLLDNEEKARVGKYLQPRPAGEEKEKKALKMRFKGLDAPVLDSTYYTRAFLKIQDGCNWGCSYCIVPRARGRSRSRPPEQVIRQAGRLVKRGYREIVLTGIHIGHYGLDLTPRSDLAALLSELAKLPDPVRIRLSSLEPTEFGAELLRVISDNEKICPHFHIPLQSADDEILKAMGRRYHFAQYQELLEKLRAAFPDAALGADVIVGFPGETEDSFEKTYRRIKRLPLTYLHVFSYSRRPGTRAAQLPGQVNPREKKSRSSRLRRLGRQKQAAFHQAQLGQVRPGLILARRDAQSGRLVGLSDNYINILVEAGDELINKIVPLRLSGLAGGQVLGEID